MPDGRVLIGFSGNGQFRLLRLQSDGQIDPLFLANAPSPLSLHKVQPDGRLLVSGRLAALATSASALFRVMDDGTVDPSFDPLANEDFVRQTLLQPDGKIVVSTGNGQVFRLMSNEQLASAFQPFTINGQYGAMALAPDGRTYRAIPYGGLKWFLNDVRPDPVFLPPYLPSDAGLKGFQMLTAPAGRILVDYQTWNGTGGIQG